MAKWGVLAVLGAAQFLMVLDQAVMNVAISQLVAAVKEQVQVRLGSGVSFVAPVAAALVLAALFGTRNLPARRFDELAGEPNGPPASAQSNRFS